MKAGFFRGGGWVPELPKGARADGLGAGWVILRPNTPLAGIGGPAGAGEVAGARIELKGR